MNQNPGCLGFLFGLFQPPQPRKNQPSIDYEEQQTDTPSLAYYKKPYFFPKSEQAFFEALRSAVGQKVFIFPHVRLWDVIDMPRNDPNYMTLRNKIQSKHVDFVLVKPKTYETMLVIELDGRSHKRKRQKASDQVKDAALAAAGVPILRYKVETGYDPQTILTAIRAKLEYSR